MEMCDSSAEVRGDYAENTGLFGGSYFTPQVWGETPQVWGDAERVSDGVRNGTAKCANMNMYVALNAGMYSIEMQP